MDAKEIKNIWNDCVEAQPGGDQTFVELDPVVQAFAARLLAAHDTLLLKVETIRSETIEDCIQVIQKLAALTENNDRMSMARLCIEDIRSLQPRQDSEKREIPEEVQKALDRMRSPLHESRLSGATAQEDARCMKVIADYIAALSSPAAIASQGIYHSRNGFIPVQKNGCADIADSFVCDGDELNELASGWEWQPATRLIMAGHDAALSVSSTQEGWVSLPVELTDEMREAGIEALRDGHHVGTWGECGGFNYHDADGIYKAMIAAAPKAAKQEKE